MSKFQPATMLVEEGATNSCPSDTPQAQKQSLFQGGLNFQPFRKDPAKQERYDKYLALVKQGEKGG